MSSNTRLPARITHCLHFWQVKGERERKPHLQAFFQRESNTNPPSPIALGTSQHGQASFGKVNPAVSNFHALLAFLTFHIWILCGLIVFLNCAFNTDCIYLFWTWFHGSLQTIHLWSTPLATLPHPLGFLCTILKQDPWDFVCWSLFLFLLFFFLFYVRPLVLLSFVLNSSLLPWVIVFPELGFVCLTCCLHS